ncbi:SRPBCC family protein [Aureliella helgolandensis]|uniref:Activator of Hsp90 ATPase homologue 1/2-like C-terminal domain-containing protein n=1 Tax=Aureliella helgolandensis TaxID=2527968 RepID=A0A518G492_9BACT|nr:SRPBCC family protein [Aureliella helgolandensis]QDV23413.1 hypothetical protein Q31a_17110 [Aureliella helgolandensis]
MKKSETDNIEKAIEIAAPLERVWKAVTDYREFGQWFHVNLESEFAVGERTAGQVSHPGFEHVRMEVITTAIEPMTYFAFQWHPHAVNTDVDYTHEPLTLVEFRFRSNGNGTSLQIIESGFDALPPGRRDEAFRMNEKGWEGQIKNIARHVATHE